MISGAHHLKGGSDVRVSIELLALQVASAFVLLGASTGGAAIFAAAAVTSLAMFGCSSLNPDMSHSKHPRLGYECTSAEQCKVQVSMDCSVTPYQITVPDDQQIVVANGFTVVWEIVPATGQSYLFKHDGGISFKTSEGQHAFQNCHLEQNDARLKWQGDRNRNAYEYAIGPAKARLSPPFSGRYRRYKMSDTEVKAGEGGA